MIESIQKINIGLRLSRIEGIYTVYLAFFNINEMKVFRRIYSIKPLSKNKKIDNKKKIKLDYYEAVQVLILLQSNVDQNFEFRQYHTIKSF